MKIHKIDEKRIYFIMDSGACGSISRNDIGKLTMCNAFLDVGKADPRTNLCLSEAAMTHAMAYTEKFEVVE